MSRAAQKGMTLPEVMIALLIFAAISSASIYALRLSVDSRDQLAAADLELKSMQIARTLIKEDMAQLTKRTVRDEFGAKKAASFYGNLVSYGGRVEDDEKLLASFVRNGWRNPDAGEPRSALQYVEYIFKNGSLIRRSRLYLDDTSGADTIERVLFEGLIEAHASFLIGPRGDELEWADIWPVSGGVNPPRALSLTLEQDGRAPIRQYFWIGEIS